MWNLGDIKQIFSNSSEFVQNYYTNRIIKWKYCPLNFSEKGFNLFCLRCICVDLNVLLLESLKFKGRFDFQSAYIFFTKANNVIRMVWNDKIL